MSILDRPPAQGTWSVMDDKEVVFEYSGNLADGIKPCNCCAFLDDTRCASLPCGGGTYIEKSTYLSMKLLGEIK